MAKTNTGFSNTTIQSFRKAAGDIAKAARRLNGLAGPGLRVIGEEIMMDVKNARPGHGVPVDEGTLRDTGTVVGPTGTQASPQVELSFGDAATKYALIQHENMTFHHPIGEPRYLVRGVERWSAQDSAGYALMQAKAKAGLKNGGI